MAKYVPGLEAVRVGFLAVAGLTYLAKTGPALLTRGPLTLFGRPFV